MRINCYNYKNPWAVREGGAEMEFPKPMHYIFPTYSSLLSLSTEMANGGKPLFPGSDVDEQLKRVFKYPHLQPTSHTY